MSDFMTTLFAAGLRPRDVVADGKWRRCPTDDKPRKRNGAYVLHPDGRGYWRNWATDDGLNTWGGEVRRIDPAVMAARREQERRQRQVAIKGARLFWAQSRPLRGGHPYLTAKGLSMAGTTGLRVHGELLVVPVMWGESMTSVQTISPDGQKRFWTGAPVKAGAHVLRRSGSVLTAVCEGLATGLAIYQCVPQASVIVAFDAGNLPAVVDRLRPTGAVVICADNDLGTQARRGVNPGVQKATEAAQLIGAGVAAPDGIEGTDWADALYEGGPLAAKRISRAIVARAQYVT